MNNKQLYDLTSTP